jgi:peroxiredoxin
MQTQTGQKIEISPMRKGDIVKPRKLTTIRGKQIDLPDPAYLVHLQFRRYAGCPVCNLHLRTIAKRNDDILAAGIKEVVVFHSKAETMLEFQNQLPFAAIPDPEKRLYAEFGADRKMSRVAALNPRSWFIAINALARAPTLHGASGKGEETMGLPADFLIDSNGEILAVNYGKRVDDHWSVDKLLSLAK